MYQWQYEYQCYTGSHTTCIEAIDTIIGINNVHCKDNELWMTITQSLDLVTYTHVHTHTCMPIQWNMTTYCQFNCGLLKIESKRSERGENTWLWSSTNSHSREIILIIKDGLIRQVSL